MNSTAESVINLACALNITTDIIILTSQCSFISNCLLALLLFNVNVSKSICYKYTKPIFHVSIKCLSLNDFWGFGLKKFLFRVSVLLFWITTLLIIHTLPLLQSAYALLAVCSVHHGAKHHQFPLQLLFPVLLGGSM